MKVRELFGDPIELGEEDAREWDELLVRLAQEGVIMRAYDGRPYCRGPGRIESGERRLGWDRVRGGGEGVEGRSH